MAVSSRNQGSERTLKQLLDGMQVSHSRDIAAFAGGHLNESNLWKAPEASVHHPWKSALKPHIHMVPPTSPSKLPTINKGNSKVEKMTETLANFSSGTLGTVPLNPDNKQGSSMQMMQQSYASDSMPHKGPCEKVFIEELKLPELLVMKRTSQINKSTQGKDSGWTKDTPIQHLKHEFLPSYMDAVTKKDQFQKFKQFEEDILHKSETTEKHVMSGYKTVSHLEQKLQLELEKFPFVTRGANFHRLQVFSTVFSDLINGSSTFGYMLQTIKDEYDGYLSTLLDSQPGRHNKLHYQVEQLSSGGTSNPHLLQQQVHHLTDTETQARQLLDINERLRDELRREEELSEKAEHESPQMLRTQSVQDRKLELVDQIEELHANILERLDSMKELRNRLKTQYVPSCVCNHLEQCVKETEVEIQQLLSQKEFYHRSTLDMESELQEAIDSADTTEKDLRRVWKKVNKVKSDAEGHVILEDSDNEMDEECKWNWYIS